ncbi:hypothetical protein [Brevibacillus porteri]|uniref:hypothetical protein n=1 Tax=Brevibacillus porteri TaxID=2126350 RepID=UPI003634F551
MFKWKNRTMAIHEAYKLVKETEMKVERVCEYIVTKDERFCSDVEFMTKRQFNSFVKDVAKLFE